MAFIALSPISCDADDHELTKDKNPSTNQQLASLDHIYNCGGVIYTVVGKSSSKKVSIPYIKISPAINENRAIGERNCIDQS